MQIPRVAKLKIYYAVCYTSETIIATGLVVASDVYLSLHSIEVIYFATTNAQQIKQISRGCLCYYVGGKKSAEILSDGI